MQDKIGVSDRRKQQFLVTTPQLTQGGSVSVVLCKQLGVWGDGEAQFS